MDLIQYTITYFDTHSISIFNYEQCINCLKNEYDIQAIDLKYRWRLIDLKHFHKLEMIIKQLTTENNKFDNIIKINNHF